ncbi:hypothetical protein [Knoellia koreensis]|nr:hypothetical protein [Knoellia sp. DB2414S]
MTTIHRMLIRSQLRLRDHVGGLAAQRRERGDVPGWVMITLMTAGIVVVLWQFAGDALVGLFEESLNNVRKGGN